MNLPPPKSNGRRVSVAIIIFFLGLLWLPTLDEFFHLDGSRPPGENRLPAMFPPPPEKNFASLHQFIGGLEAYYNDHFGFRKKLIRWFQNWKLGFYRDRSVYKVINGQDHWLFFGEAEMVEHFLGIAKFTPVQLQTWQKLLEKRRDWLAARGINYLFVVAPDKQSVYPEMLPAWLGAAAPKNRETKLDQFLAYMKTHSTVQILDLRAPLLAAKKIAPTYLQNDTHWNLFGGFIGAQTLVQTIAEQFPEVPLLALSDFDWTNTPATGGDLSKMLGTETPERYRYTFTPKFSLTQVKSSEDLKYPTGWGLKRLLTLENPASTSMAAVFFTDSFGVAWEQFLGRSFKKIVFLGDNRAFNPQLINATHPKIVVNEMLERFFCTEDPVPMLAKDALP